MKILSMGLYKPSSFNEKDFLFYLNKPYKFFTMIPENKKISDFFCEMKFKHLILKPICCKGLLLSTIDLLLTNHKQSFMRLDVYEAGVSDHHKMMISVL